MRYLYLMATVLAMSFCQTALAKDPRPGDDPNLSRKSSGAIYQITPPKYQDPSRLNQGTKGNSTIDTPHLIEPSGKAAQ